MKRFFALVLVLVMIASCMMSCSLFGNKDNGGNDNAGADSGESNNGGSGDTNGEKPSEDKKPVIEEDDGDVDVQDNLDPDGWTTVDKQ